MRDPAVPPHAVLLAAGAARRFGGPKLLAPVDGRPMLEHAVRALESALRSGNLARVHAVHREDAPEVAALIPAAWRVPIPVAEAEAGLSASLRLGVRAADAAGAPAVLVCLADQPRLSPLVLAMLVAGWRAGAEIVRPLYAEEPDVPGHPLLLDRRHYGLAAETSGDRGLDPLLRRHHLAVALASVPGRNPDIDTPDDLART